MGARVKLLDAGHGLMLLVAVAGAVLTSEASDWDPVWLAPALLAIAMVSDALALRLRDLRISGSFAVLVLAMVLMGPAPAVAIAAASILLDGLRCRLERTMLLANLAVYTFFPLVGGMLFERLEPSADGVLLYGTAVLFIFLVTLLLNFLLVYGGRVVRGGVSLVTGWQTVFMPVLPAEFATALLTAALAVLGRDSAESVVILAGMVLVFQYLLGFALDAMSRGDQLQERNRQLAALHVGLITTTLKTLALRDHMTARHSAAVARYARAMAERLGLDEAAQEVIHTAALFHDVGKFIFPDSILLADRRLTKEEFDVVKRHPVVGADLIREIEGYDEVADIVRWHHERIDGHGYPDGLGGDAIPLGSRIIAVADVYDVITSRDTYRKPVSVSEAFAELRRSAGTQLDNELVELFIELVETRGVRFRHSTAHDFEQELALERRVSAHAAPLRRAA